MRTQPQLLDPPAQVPGGAQGKPWFQWSDSFDPSPSDPRNIQFRDALVREFGYDPTENL